MSLEVGGLVDVSSVLQLAVGVKRDGKLVVDLSKTEPQLSNRTAEWHAGVVDVKQLIYREHIPVIGGYKLEPAYQSLGDQLPDSREDLLLAGLGLH